MTDDLNALADRLQLGTGWTPALKLACADRCGEEFGDPPCWALAGDTRTGSTPRLIEPCAECLTAQQEGQR